MSYTKTYQARIYTCPHCKTYIGINQTSVIGEKHLIELIYTDLDRHLEKCYLSKNTKPKTVELTIEEITKQAYASSFKYINSKITI